MENQNQEMNQQQEQQNQDMSNARADENKQQQEQKDIMIPKTRFDEVNNQFKAMKEQLDALLAEKAQADEARKKAEEEALAKQGKFEELYKSANDKATKLEGDYKTTSERVQALEGVINQLLEAKLADIPEDFHDLIPSGMTAEQKLAWVTQAEAKGLFGKKQQSTQPIGGQTNPNGNQAQVDISKLSPMQLLKAGYGAN